MERKQRYEYVFTHVNRKAKLKFQSGSIEEATQELAKLVNSVAVWNMKRFKLK